MDANTRYLSESLARALALNPENEFVRESFDRVRQLLDREDRYWALQWGSGDMRADEFGLTLSDLKSWGKKILPSVVGASWMGRGFRLRANYTWENGIRYGNIPGSKGSGTQGQRNVSKIIDRPGNQLHFFGKEARRKRELALYSEGVAFWKVHQATGDIETIPLRQITGELLDPTGIGLVWAYKREWTEYDITTGNSEKKTRWYFTDRFADRRVKEIRPAGGGDPVEVDQAHLIVDQHANGIAGLAYGYPDALAAWIWNNIARDATMDGVSMQQALAMFALKASAGSQDGEKSAALQLASPQGAGNFAVVGGPNDLVPLSSAGKGYDFESLRFLVSIIASGLDVSVIHLTANPGDAGGSYGSAQTLDLPTRLAMAARRDEHVEVDKRMLRLLGVKDPEVGFIPFNSGEETYRAVQALGLEYAGDTMSRQEYRDRLDDLQGRPNGTVPPEDQRPSVLAAKALAKAVPQQSSPSGDAGAPGSQKQIASPTQGRSNGTGGQQGGNASNDIRRE